MNIPDDILLSCFAWLVLFLLPLFCLSYLVYDCLSGPIRRKERARMVLDLIEVGARQGKRPEDVLRQAAQTADPSLGKRFQAMAARLEAGERLSQALQDVRKLLPAQVAATLRVGEELGDVRKVLPACRGLLHDAESQTRNGFNYMVIASLVIMPTMPIIILILNIVVFPKFREITFMYDETLPGLAIFAMDFSRYTGLVLFNGLVVGCIFIGLFSVLIALIQ
jgi:type II secretory pathway component PulF